MKKWLIFTLLIGFMPKAKAQSLEIMPGNNRVFADIQWLQPLEPSYQFSLFSRTRATVTYEQQTDVFTGAYLNYTRFKGFGFSLVGRIDNRVGGGDCGLHYFKNQKDWTAFVLLSAALDQADHYSLFSIVRYRPSINEHWKWFSGMELYIAWLRGDHRVSVGRLRAGAEWKGLAFGLGADGVYGGEGVQLVYNNFGIFLRRQFP